MSQEDSQFPENSQFQKDPFGSQESGPVTPQKVTRARGSAEAADAVGSEESEEEIDESSKWEQVDQLVQMLGELHKMSEISTRWKLQENKFTSDITNAIEEFQVGITQLSSQLSDHLSKDAAQSHFKTYKIDYNTIFAEFNEIKDVVKSANEPKRLRRNISDPVEQDKS